MKECNISKKCGGCNYQGLEYAKQLRLKEEYVNTLYEGLIRTEPIVGMDNPYYYRNKVHHALSYDRKYGIINGPYEEASHWVLYTKDCLVEDKKCQEIANDICSLIKSFGYSIYNEDTKKGILRHILVRRGFNTNEIMAVLIAATNRLPSKKDFAKELRKMHPEITTFVLNINNRTDSLVLGNKNEIIWGTGYIQDVLCGKKFRLSPDAFYQINSVQTEKLYAKAIEFADLQGNETLIDAYCGIGTIGLSCIEKIKKLIGIEINENAVKDAIVNAKINNADNAFFIKADAGDYMKKMADSNESADVVILDPPRSGSSNKFLDSLESLAPNKVIYISCDPKTQLRDVKYLLKRGYQIDKLASFDMFPFTKHVETICLLSKKHVNPKAYVEIGVDAPGVLQNQMR